MSCASSHLCVAITFSRAALRYDGHRWSKLASSRDGFAAVSCATGSTFCLLIDDGGNYTVLRDGNVTAPRATGDPSGFFRAVSCSSGSFCAALDGNGRVLEWTHGSWTAPIHHQGGQMLSTLSCTSRNFCVAAGGRRSETFTGTRWTDVRRVPGASNLSSISCVGHRMCVAVDSNTGSAFVAR